MVLVLLSACVDETIKQDVSKRSDAISDTSTYMVLRGNALAQNRQSLGLELPDSAVYGLIIDWEKGDGISTLVAFQSGDASIYFSSGGGIIGGIQHEEVKVAVQQLIAQAQEDLVHMELTKTTPLPHNDCIRFYALTGLGVYTYQEVYSKLEDQSSVMSTLFGEANKVIAAIRRQE